MKVLHIVPDYFSAPLYKRFFKALHDIGISSSVFVADNIGGEDIKTEQETIYCYPHAFSPLERFLFFPKQRLLRTYAEQNSIDDGASIIHAHLLFSAGYLAYVYKKTKKIPYIVAIRNTDINVFFKHMIPLRKIGIKILLQSDKVILISPAYKDQLEIYLSEDEKKIIFAKTEVIPNGINPIFLENCSCHSMDQKEIRLIYVGKISRSKNIPTLLRVVKTMQQRGYAVHLTAVGPVVDLSLSPMLSNNPHITHHPMATQEEVLEYLRQSDIFIMPSFKETFGLVYAEAMSQGLPIIYTRGQGIDGYFTNGEVGYAIDPKNIDDIIDSVLRIQQNYADLSKRCCSDAKQFDWKQIAIQYKKIYEEITE